MNITSKSSTEINAALVQPPENIINIDTLHHLAFENSFVATIITDAGSGQIVSVNKAACKLLGYSKTRLLEQNRSAIFDVRNQLFKKGAEEQKWVGHAIVFVKVIKKNGLAFSCEVTSAVFLDEEGLKKEIFTINDLRERINKQKSIDRKKDQVVAGNIVLALTKQKKIDTRKAKLVAEDIVLAQAKSDARLVENNQWIKYIAKTSYDVMWDWDIASGEIYVGDSIAEVFGYKIKNNRTNFKDFISTLVPDEKSQVEERLSKSLESTGKLWKDAYLLIRNDGSIATTTSRASILRDDEGKAIRLIGATQDISRLQELEAKLGEQMSIKGDQALFLNPRFSSDVMWDWNLLTNELFIGDEFETLFGHAIENNRGHISNKNSYLHADDACEFQRSLDLAVASSDTYWEHSYRFVRADGSVARVHDRASIFRDAGGKAYRMLGTLQDVTNKAQLHAPQDVQAVTEKKTQLIQKIKNVIVELVRTSDEQLMANFSVYLSGQLDHNYTYLANVFSEVEGSTIQKFIISQKIEHVKELLVQPDLNLTEIAWKLHYSSVAHLSNQFKKTTGVTPSSYKLSHQLS